LRAAVDGDGQTLDLDWFGTVLAPLNPVRAPAIGFEPESAAGGIVSLHPRQPASDLVAHHHHAFRRRGGEDCASLFDGHVVLTQARLFRRDVRRRGFGYRR
jgi:hypothetical protein